MGVQIGSTRAPMGVQMGVQKGESTFCTDPFFYMKSDVGIRPPTSAHKYANLISLFSSDNWHNSLSTMFSSDNSHNNSLRTMFSSHNSHNNSNMTKSTVSECYISCVKRGYLRLLTMHISPTPKYRREIREYKNKTSFCDVRSQTVTSWQPCLQFVRAVN